ncbi:finger putative transcription factor family-related [Holotrichia oblita]|nr:finger putative transcription factor family-related [Holotrichia oblita]
MENNQDVTKVCRTCLTQAKFMHTIFEVKLSNVQNIRIIDFIRRLTSIKITKSNDLPSNICIHCINDLCKAFDFAQMCIENDIKLKTWINNSPPSDANQTVKDAGQEKENCIVSDSKLAIAEESKEFEDEVIILKNDSDYIKSTLASENKSFDELLDVNVGSNEEEYIEEEQHQILIEEFECNICCITAESLRRHMKTHDTNYVKKMHSCKVCAKEFRYPSFLAEHMKNHTGERPFLCSICGKGFRQSGALQYHIRSHTGSRPYACNVCSKSFSSPGVLKIHMRRHTDERPYVCDICGMAFRQSTDMRTHRRTHTGEKPALCTICGKRFSSSSQLNIHIRTHTGEKPFLCSSCSKSFATRDMLIKHERIHTGERPYVCKICFKAFNQSSTLKTHLNTHKTTKAVIHQSSEQDNMKGGREPDVLLMPTPSVTTLSTEAH